jgi:hypothetical protein
MEPGAASDVPQWHVAGDWFDVCRCDIPCPCEFAQARLTTGARACLPGTSVKGTTGTCRSMT